MSPETRKKISEVQIGRKQSEETKRKRSMHRHTEEAKRKISEAGRRREWSEETKRKISEAQVGRKHSEETKKKMSESRRKYFARLKTDADS